MSDVNAALAEARTAVDQLVAAAERSAGKWTVPRAPGKWSPSQITEHIALSLEESAHVVSGTPSKFPTLPVVVRPLTRFFFKRVLKKEAFPKARALKAFNPASGPASPAAAKARLEAALDQFDRACRAREASGQPIQSGGFGTISVEDYARFQAIHTRHHCKQMPEA